jgi:hypothetical protein
MVAVELEYTGKAQTVLQVVALQQAVEVAVELLDLSVLLLVDQLETLAVAVADAITVVT